MRFFTPSSVGDGSFCDHVDQTKSKLPLQHAQERGAPEASPFSASEEESVPSLEAKASSDINHAIAKTHPNATMPQGAARERLSTAFVGTGTLPYQSLQQPPATTMRAPVHTVNLGLDRHHPGHEEGVALGPDEEYGTSESSFEDADHWPGDQGTHGEESVGDYLR